MKKILFIVCVLFYTYTSMAQEVEVTEPDGRKVAITVGFLNGASLLGVDLEFLLTDRVGFQIGGGLIGYSAGLNYHLKPGIRSSFMSMQYWHQGGSGSTHTQSLVSGNFVYRYRKLLQAQIGIGFPTAKGDAWPTNTEQPHVMLTYAIGLYFPL